MSQTKTTSISYHDVLRSAKSGRFKLPAFQRKWTWTAKQVMGLYESLRLGYPIGSFLFLTSEEGRKLHPRAFHGAGKAASSRQDHESLVLDGQQRITAGLSICFGVDDVRGFDYFIDIAKVDQMLTERKINVEEDSRVNEFCCSIDLEDGYITARANSKDRKKLFAKNRLLWTAYLTEDHQTELDEILEDCSDPRTKDLVRKVARKYLKPKLNIQVPIIELGNEFDLAQISKVFSTINSTGKALTSFELVVAILYPNDIRLEDDVEQFKQKHRYYANMDKNGEILLQCIALRANRSPKKSDLPRNIDARIYSDHAQWAADKLDFAGKFLSEHLGCALDTESKLVPYDAIFAPLALVLAATEERKLTNSEKGAAYKKIRRWFVSSAVSQRYQEGVHNKQERDLADIVAWIDDDERIPAWIDKVTVTPAIKDASPNGAIGKLFLCLINSKKPKDPISGSTIGFGDGIQSAHVHHIFPTRWAPKGIKDHSKGRMETNLAFNTMMLSAETNSDWLNFDPRNQVEKSIEALGSAHCGAFANQLISEAALGVLLRPEKLVADYHEFIDDRYAEFVRLLSEYGVQSVATNLEQVDFDSPTIDEN